MGGKQKGGSGVHIGLNHQAICTLSSSAKQVSPEDFGHLKGSESDRQGSCGLNKRMKAHTNGFICSGHVNIYGGK